MAGITRLRKTTFNNTKQRVDKQVLEMQFRTLFAVYFSVAIVSAAIEIGQATDCDCVSQLEYY